MKLVRFKLLLIVFALCAPYTSADTSNQNADYGPQPPTGYNEQKAKEASGWDRVSSWISSVKSAVTVKIQNLISRPSTESQNTNRQLASSGSAGAPANGASLPSQVQTITERLTAMPDFVLPKSVSVPGDLSAPVLTFKNRKPVLDLHLDPQSNQNLSALEIKKHVRYAVSQEAYEPVTINPKYFSPAPSLHSLSNQEIKKIELMNPEERRFFKGLFSILFYKDDEAVTELHPLSLTAKNMALRQKSLTFLGWMYEDHGLKSLAALAFSQAPNIGADQTERYDDDAISSLSRLAKDSPTAKLFVKTSTLAKSRLHSSEAQGFSALLQAEREYDKRSFSAARKLAQSVPAKSSWKEQARYLASISLIAPKDTKETNETAGRELTELFKTVESPEVFDATAVTLGRIHFILGNYKAAHQYLSQVSRETNLFIESAVDNAWSLLRSGDRNHAVGNMFTLHTQYFEGAYMPESYFIRSLGYQEICQFGDALTSVKSYKQLYGNSFKQLSDFNAAKKTPESAYYDDLVAYLSKKTPKMPPIVLRELGRHPEFLRRQKTLNLLSREEQSLSKSFPTTAAAISSWSTSEFAQVRANFKMEIAKYLKVRALAIEEELKFLTANIALLEYEIFAGAGSNLSLQGAKNFAVDDKGAPKREFEAGKEYWPYEDEIWEDELNNFRSKMVDGCAKVKSPEKT